MQLPRKCFHNIEQQFKLYQAVAILGPRQCGKTTLAQHYAQNHPKVTWLDLEDPRDYQSLQEPMLVLENLSGLIIIDEIQHRPEILEPLRVLIDHPKVDQQFLLLGSASPTISKRSSETLAGRIGFVDLTPFTVEEIEDWHLLWQRGGFPRSYLAKDMQESMIWRKNYIRTFLERDIPGLGFRIAPQSLSRFWQMLTHYHGKIVNLSELARSMEVNHNTTKHYLDILCGTYMIRQLPAWYENIAKRQVKTPKVYFRDSGILNTLMEIHSEKALLTHPQTGHLWEGFALEQVIQIYQHKTQQFYFWGIHAEAELDLLVLCDGKRIGFEFKYSSQPKASSSMKLALSLLKLDELIVITPGNQAYTLDEQIQVKGIQALISEQSF